MIRRVLEGEAGAARTAVELNAAAAILVSGVADSWEAALERARSSIDEGHAAGALEALRRVSNEV